MPQKIILILLLLTTSCSYKMKINKIPYNSQLKKIEFADIPFDKISITGIPEPYYKDYSHETDRAYKNYKSWDKMGFKLDLLKSLNTILDDEVIRVKIITPTVNSTDYTVFAYLKSKQIVGLFIESVGNFEAWMHLFFKKQYEKREEDIKDGLFIRQPELNPEASFMLSFDVRGGFSLSSVHTGMKFDEKPFENSGFYLYSKAPKQYNEVKIAKEKQNYIKKYINTSGSEFDTSQLIKLFSDLLTSRGLKPEPPINNDEVYKNFEALAGYAFPEELKTVFNLHNGIENLGFLNAEQVLNEWKSWKAIYDDVNWMLIDLTGNNHPDGRKTVGIYTNPYWVPFFHDGSGNFMAIDYAPGSKGTSGQIIAFGADEIKIRLIAESMEEFLKEFINTNHVLYKGLKE